MAVDTTSGFIYILTKQNLVLKLDSTGAFLLKANPGTMAIASLDLSTDFSKLLIAGTLDSKCTLMVLSTTDLTVLHYFQVSATS